MYSRHCLYGILCLVCMLLPTKARAAETAFPNLSPKAEISLLTCSPGHEVWAHYGHTAIRVKDPANRIDLTFNYGLFNFHSKHFLWDFVTGNTYYILGYTRTSSFLEEYKEEKRLVTEQILNLRPAEKEQLWNALCLNSLPENRTYLYNFFYDNCATRARIIIEKNIDGEVRYLQGKPYHSLRQVVAHYTQDHPWTWFGISLTVSSPADRETAFIDLLFAPELMQEAFSKAFITDSIQGMARPLVRETKTAVNSLQTPPKTTFPRPGPKSCFWLLFAFGLGLFAYEWKRHYHAWWFDGLVFGIAGLIGIVIAFLAFVSIHPAVQHNYLLLWLHPLQGLFALSLCFSKLRKRPFPSIYSLIQFLLSLSALVGFGFFPQYFHPATIPFLATLMLRNISIFIEHKRR